MIPSPLSLFSIPWVKKIAPYVSFLIGSILLSPKSPQPYLYRTDWTDIAR